MSVVNSLLAKRLKTKDKSVKMAEMSRQSAGGNLSSFAGIFSVSELASHEKEILESILRDYTQGTESIEPDLESLISITSEVKAINNQAAILHGERIKRAQTILTKYLDGAFTAWMIAAYGNRQTPYNLLQYYEFYSMMPKNLRPQIEAMPKQAIYTLASREGPVDKKQQIIEMYKGETKQELLGIIREIFPLDDDDKRKASAAETLISNLQKASKLFSKHRGSITRTQKKNLVDILDYIKEMVEACKMR